MAMNDAYRVGSAVPVPRFTTPRGPAVTGLASINADEATTPSYQIPTYRQALNTFVYPGFGYLPGQGPPPPVGGGPSAPTTPTTPTTTPTGAPPTTPPPVTPSVPTAPPVIDNGGGGGEFGPTTGVPPGGPVGGGNGGNGGGGILGPTTGPAPGTGGGGGGLGSITAGPVAGPVPSVFPSWSGIDISGRDVARAVLGTLGGLVGSVGGPIGALAAGLAARGAAGPLYDSIFGTPNLADQGQWDTPANPGDGGQGPGGGSAAGGGPSGGSQAGAGANEQAGGSAGGASGGSAGGGGAGGGAGQGVGGSGVADSQGGVGSGGGGTGTGGGTGAGTGAGADPNGTSSQNVSGIDPVEVSGYGTPGAVGPVDPAAQAAKEIADKEFNDALAAQQQQNVPQTIGVYGLDVLNDNPPPATAIDFSFPDWGTQLSDLATPNGPPPEPTGTFGSPDPDATDPVGGVGFDDPGFGTNDLATDYAGTPEIAGGTFGDSDPDAAGSPETEGGGGGGGGGGGAGGGGSAGENGGAGGGSGSAGGSAMEGNEAAGGQDGSYMGGPITPDMLGGPNPPGPDDGYVALDRGEFVIPAAQASRYGDILQAIRSGTFNPQSLQQGQSGMMTSTPTIGMAEGFPPDGSDQHEMGESPYMEAAEGAEDGEDDGMGSPLMPANDGMGVNPADAMQRAQMLPPQARMALASTLMNPEAGGALLQVLGPAFAPLVQTLATPGPAMGGMGAPPMHPGMGGSPMTPMGGGAGAMPVQPPRSAGIGSIVA